MALCVTEFVKIEKLIGRIKNSGGYFLDYVSRGSIVAVMIFNVNIQFDPLDSRCLKIKFNTLLEALYYSLTFCCSAKRTYKRCEKCDSFFLISMGDPKRVTKYAVKKSSDEQKDHYKDTMRVEVRCRKKFADKLSEKVYTAQRLVEIYRNRMEVIRDVFDDVFILNKDSCNGTKKRFFLLPDYSLSDYFVYCPSLFIRRISEFRNTEKSKNKEHGIYNVLWRSC